MKTLKSHLSPLVALIVCASLMLMQLMVPAVAMASQQLDAPTMAATATQPGARHTSFNFLKPRVCSINQSSSDTECATSAGILLSVCAFGVSLANGAYSLAYNTTVAITNINTQVLGLISPMVFADSNTAALVDGGGSRCWNPLKDMGAGVPFDKLHGIQSGAVHATKLYYLLESDLTAAQ